MSTSIARKTVPIIVVVALLGALAVNSTPAPAGKKTTRVKVDNNFFAPSKKTIKKGTKVKFKWTGGGAPHNVKKRRGPGRGFKSRTTSARGVHFKKKFRKRGKYKLFCTIHPNSMRLTLKVR